MDNKKERDRRAHQKYYQKHRDEILARAHKSWEKNKDKIRARERRYRADNPEHVKELRRIRRTKKRLDYNAAARKYLHAHPEKARQWKRANPIRFWASRSRTAHKKAGCTIDISLAALVAIAEKSPTCFYCDAPLDYSAFKGRSSGNSPTLDRRDNTSTINPENVNIICHLCNRTKQARTHAEFVEYCSRVVNKHLPAMRFFKRCDISAALLRGNTPDS